MGSNVIFCRDSGRKKDDSEGAGSVQLSNSTSEILFSVFWGTEASFSSVIGTSPSLSKTDGAG